ERVDPGDERAEERADDRSLPMARPVERNRGAAGFGAKFIFGRIAADDADDLLDRGRAAERDVGAPAHVAKHAVLYLNDELPGGTADAELRHGRVRGLRRQRVHGFEQLAQFLQREAAALL